MRTRAGGKDAGRGGPRGRKASPAKSSSREEKKAKKKSARDWSCDWCGNASHQHCIGPKGPSTLCASCGSRYGLGATGPIPKDWRCAECATTDPGGQHRPGPKGRFTLCESCFNANRRKKHQIEKHRARTACKRPKPSKAKTPAKRKKVANPAEPRARRESPRLKHARGDGDDAPDVRGLKVALAKVTRERDEAQDRNECIVCMERPRAVLVEPCNHLFVCTTCAAALAECPNCRATITRRITVANSS